MNNKGISLVALSITIIVIIIIAGVTTYSGIESTNKAKESKLQTELVVVSQAIEEIYYKYTISENESTFVGTKLNSLDGISSEIRSKLQDQASNYYELSPAKLKSIGVMNTEDTYIVNYRTGEVINKTQNKYKEGTVNKAINFDGKDH